MKISPSLFLAYAALAAFSCRAAAAPGDLDLSFGGTGNVITQISSGAIGTSVAIQSDGKIVVAGGSYNSSYDWTVVRHNVDGSLDTSFNGTGKVITPIGIGHDYSYGVVLQSDGKIVVAGYSSNSVGFHDFAVVRYTANGSLDTSFNGIGKVITAIDSGDDGAWGIALQSDGKILVVGYSSGAQFSKFALARYKTNGSLDTSFNGTGKVITDFGFSSGANGTSVAVQSDGKIVAAGAVAAASRWRDFWATRISSRNSLRARIS